MISARCRFSGNVIKIILLTVYCTNRAQSYFELFHNHFEIPQSPKSSLSKSLKLSSPNCSFVNPAIDHSKFNTPNFQETTRRQSSRSRSKASLIRINHCETSSSTRYLQRNIRELEIRCRQVYMKRRRAHSVPPSVSWFTFYRDIAETRCSNNGYERKREESFNRPSGNVKRMQQRTTNSCDDFGGRTTNFGKSSSTQVSRPTPRENRYDNHGREHG